MRSLRRAPRVAAWALLALAVLLMHGLLLQALLPPLAAPAPVASRGPGVMLRLIALAAPEPEPVASPVVAVPTPKPPPRPRAPSASPTPVQAPAESAALPVYATRLPDAASLYYRLQRGETVGMARLQWQREAGDYLLRLDTDWPGQPAAGSASRGLIDSEGVAPVRHAELRRSREVRAANFQREAGRITFSGPQLAYALPPGAQDRLSWMIQLPGVLQADAALARAGAQVTLFVVGTRGDAEPWRFEVLGNEPLQLPAGEVPQALRLKREPTRPYDTRVEVWLDPARQHLPVRVVLTTLPSGQPLEMALEIDAAAPR